MKRTWEQTNTLHHGKAPMAQASQALVPNCMIVEQWAAHPYNWCQLGIVGRLQTLAVGTRSGRLKATTRPDGVLARTRRSCVRHNPDRVTDHGRAWHLQKNPMKRSPHHPTWARSLLVSMSVGSWPPKEVLPPSTSQAKDGTASKKHRIAWFWLRHVDVGRIELGRQG